jgi:hypothetical protein
VIFLNNTNLFADGCDNSTHEFCLLDDKKFQK